MDELVKDLKNTILKKSITDEYLLMNSKYVPLKIDNSNYHFYADKNTTQNMVNSNSDDTIKNILFVDGGNSVLFESAGFCLGIIRIGGIVYSKNIRVKKSLQEFYIFITEVNGKYSIKTYPDTSFNSMVFDSEDESLKNGIEKASISKIISVIRRLAEINYAYNNSNSLDFGDIDLVILDGTLESRYPYEDKYLEKLYSKKNVCALSKTCTLTTKNGYSVTNFLNDSAVTLGVCWYYNPIVINNNPLHNAELYFIKLHSKSDYVFRFEMQKNCHLNISEIFSILINNSKDPIFLGYPYGLIDVDQYVRVSDDYTRLLRMKLSAKLGKDWNELSKHLSSTNAHSILDKIKF
ncbi:MAG: DNA double-strand break repair nuclease NurA [Candidatus Woesearchaeota archaeon]